MTHRAGEVDTARSLQRGSRGFIWSKSLCTAFPVGDARRQFGRTAQRHSSNRARRTEKVALPRQAGLILGARVQRLRSPAQQREQKRKGREQRSSRFELQIQEKLPN
jgi:hypothetical protein